MPKQNQGMGDDLLSVLLEATFRAIWLAARMFSMLACGLARQPVLALVVLAGLAAWRVDGWPLVAALLVVLGVVLVGWRLAWPGSYQAHAAHRVSWTWRAPLYRMYWSHVASRCGLVAWSSTPGADGERGSRQVASLKRLRVTPAGLERLLVGVPVGLTADDVAARADAIGEAFGARTTRVVRDRPGRVWVELVRRDSLAKVVSPPTVQETTLGGVPVGLCDDGSAWRMRVSGTHTLIAGATGSGKGSVLWSLLHGLAPGIRAGWVQVWALDPKGGMELGLGRGCFARFEGGDPEAMCALLEEAVRVKDRRARHLAATGQRVHRPSPLDPHLVIVVDELATLTAFAERAVTRRIDQSLGLLLTQGRAVGISVVSAVQDPGKDVVTWRDLFPTRIALRLDNPIQVDMVLGDGARDMGARADEVSELTPGVGFVRVEGTRAIRRVRASYLTDEDVQRLASGIPVMTPLAGTDAPGEGEGVAA